MSNRVCFNTYADWQGVFNKLDCETCKELLMAVFKYGLEREVSELSFVADLAFTSIKPLMDRDWEKYNKIVRRNQINSKNAGRKPKNQEKPTKSLDKINNPKNPLDYLEIQTPQIINNKIINNKIQDKNNIIESKDSLSPNGDSKEQINYSEILEFYNSKAKQCNITRCEKLTDKRKSAIRARVKEFGKEKVLEAITKVANSSFCNGHNTKNWRANFDFVFNANKIVCILEGKYDNYNQYGNNSHSNQEAARAAGEHALGDIFTEIEQRSGIKTVAD